MPLGYLAHSATCPDLNGGLSMQQSSQQSFFSEASSTMSSTSEAWGGSSSSTRMRTPRSMKGLIRKASTVDMNYPYVEPVEEIAREPWSKRPLVPSHKIPRESSDASPSWRTPVGKSVMYKPNKTRQIEQQKKVLGSLHGVRRAGKGKPKEEPKEAPAEEPKKPASPSKKDRRVSVYSMAMLATPEDEQDSPLIMTTLLDREDKSEDLQKAIGELRAAITPVEDASSAQHASALIAKRNLAVVERKQELLVAVEERLRQFQAVDKRREWLFDGVMKGTTEAPVEMLGVDKFLKGYVHADGEPAEANRSDFDYFVRNFGLPALHRIVRRLNSAAHETTQYWANSTLARMQDENAEELDSDAIQRLIYVITNICNDKRIGDSVKEIRIMLGDRLAQQVLTFAKGMQKKDAFNVERSDQPQVESAQKCAAEIGEEISKAISLGAPRSHELLGEAKQIAVALEVEAKNRMAERALVYAKVQQGRDDAAVAAAVKADGPDGIPPVGPATDIAVQIEDAVAKALKTGAPADHPAIEECKEMAKALRDADNTRKRLLNRQRRQSQM